MTGLLAAAALVLGTVPPSVPSSFQDCDALVREAPADLASWRCYWFVGRTQAHLRGAERRLEAVLEGDPGNVRVRLVLGVVAADLGRPDAETLIRAAADGARAEGDADVEILGRISLARLMRLQRRTDEAASELDRALRRAESHGDPELEARVRVDLAWQSYYRRDYGTAWVLFRRAEALVFPEGHLQERLDVLDGLAATSWALDRGPQALEYYRRERALSGADPIRRSDIARNMATVAGDLLEEGRIEPAEADRLAREALEDARRAGNGPAETSARLLLARDLRGDEAIREVQAALDLSLRLDRPADTASALALLGRKLWDADPARPDRAFEAMGRSATVAREHGDAEGLAQSLLQRAALGREVGPTPRVVADTLAALDAVERIRDLQAGGELRARVFSRFAPEYRRAAAYFLAAGEVETAFVISERMRARQLLDTLDAAGVGGTAGPAAPLAEVRRALAGDQALVSYLVAPGAAWAIAATRDAVRAVPLPGTSGLAPRVALYLGLLARADGAERAGAAALHRSLVAPVLATLPASVTRLVIVADGPLHRLAFRDLGLAERFEVTLAPSASTWHRWRTEGVPRGGAGNELRSGVLGLADPDGTLPHARAEVASMRRSLGAGTTLTGPAATAEGLGRDALERAAVLHLAAHAVVNDERPEESSVELAGGPLRYADIVDLPLQGRLVLLSSCRSADGPVIGGEGAMGLASAFFQAGARCVVAGLWPVRDEETAALVDDLGRELGRGRTVSSALAHASRAAIRRGAPPSCWAGLVVLGDGDLVVAPVAGRGFPWGGAAVVAGLAAVLPALLLWRRRRAARSPGRP